MNRLHVIRILPGDLPESGSLPALCGKSVRPRSRLLSVGRMAGRHSRRHLCLRADQGGVGPLPGLAGAAASVNGALSMLPGSGWTGATSTENVQSRSDLDRGYALFCICNPKTDETEYETERVQTLGKDSRSDLLVIGNTCADLQLGVSRRRAAMDTYCAAIQFING